MYIYSCIMYTLYVTLLMYLVHIYEYIIYIYMHAHYIHVCVYTYLAYIHIYNHDIYTMISLIETLSTYSLHKNMGIHFSSN